MTYIQSQSLQLSKSYGRAWHERLNAYWVLRGASYCIGTLGGALEGTCGRVGPDPRGEMPIARLGNVRSSCQGRMVLK